MATTNIRVPAGQSFLHFEHIFGFEDPNWDGGILQYSVNNGPWQDASPLFVAGKNYNGTVSMGNGNASRGGEEVVEITAISEESKLPQVAEGKRIVEIRSMGYYRLGSKRLMMLY